MGKIDIPKEKLKKLYCDEYLSLDRIAKRFDVSRWKISSLFRKYNLKLREKNYKLEKFVNFIKPNIKHPKRLKDLDRVEKIISDKINYLTANSDLKRLKYD